ncbi:MAG TPA: c-type cytochrome [Chitinophaga sp.]|uniref:c-type cytochrome n=1 Tax=Chitinophaga sp. TaxID=1869181 RepID=UPI002CFD6A43|nr:c-type cytochrome [Chitinophaga sp.]HVI46971.1 c-type cytochrome [Chitinophaga sp.]
MFPRILKWAAIVLLGLLVVLLLAFGICAWRFMHENTKRYSVQVREIPIPADSATIAAGAHLYAIKGCTECHGKDLSGHVFLNDPAIGLVAGANLTTGKGGIPADYSNKDWLLALRHGVNREGRSLKIMPSYEYSKLSDHDMAAIIAYCKSQPPMDRQLPANSVAPLGKILTAIGKLPMFPAALTDHEYHQPAEMPATASTSYGEYLSVSCTGCHNPRLTGGANPVPGGKPVANITSSGHIGHWTEDDFMTTLRTGKTPEGYQLKNEDMPWKMTAQYTDEELKALFMYLKSL